MRPTLIGYSLHHQHKYLLNSTPFDLRMFVEFIELFASCDFAHLIPFFMTPFYTHFYPIVLLSFGLISLWNTTLNPQF